MKLLTQGPMKRRCLLGLTLLLVLSWASPSLGAGRHLALADGGEMTVSEVQVDGGTSLSWRMNPAIGRRTSGELPNFRGILNGGRSYDLAQDPVTHEIHLVAETLVEGRSTIALRTFTGRNWSAPLPITRDDLTAWDREPRLTFTATGEAVLAFWREAGEYAGLLVQHGIFGGTGFSTVDFAVQLEDPRDLAREVPGSMLRERGVMVHLSVDSQGDQAFLVVADTHSGDGGVLRLDLDRLSDILGGGWSPVPAGIDVPEPAGYDEAGSLIESEENETEEIAMAELIPTSAFAVKGGEAWIWGGNAELTGMALGDLAGTRTRTAVAFANTSDPTQTLKQVLEAELALAQGTTEVEPVLLRERSSRSRSLLRRR